jgi:hypothetical protein
VTQFRRSYSSLPVSAVTKRSWLTQLLLPRPVSSGASALTAATLLSVALLGCSSESSEEPGTSVGGNNSTPTAGVPSGVQQLNTSSVQIPSAPMAPPENSEMVISGDPPPISTMPAMDCGAESQSAEVKPLVLVFLFDASGSMGDGSAECFDRTLKWEPVVAAAKTFFADTASAGISATLTFFPTEAAAAGGGGGGMGGGGGGGGAASAVCDGASYETADVPLTPLPSPVFAAALDAATPAVGARWRSGTPTGPAMQGAMAQVAALKAAEPNNEYIIVLVTDGLPATCGDDLDNIDTVAGIVAEADAEGIPTYVIGVDNPAATEPAPMADAGGGGGFPGGGGASPYCVPLAGNLDTLAQSGGTDSALVVDTGNPTKTSEDFKNIINQIRDENLNCEVDIPTPPAGKVFDKNKVNVAFVDSAGTTHDLSYDPTCATPDAWKYDDEASPGAIILCDATCSVVQASTPASDGIQISAQLNVAFGCQTRAVQG